MILVKNRYFVRFGVTVVIMSMKNAILWDVVPHGLVKFSSCTEEYIASILQD
jgi:hypothetical protein